MAYTFKYRLARAPQASNDGTGMVYHDITAIASVDGETWEVVPGRHKTVLVPGDTLATVMDMPHSPGAERQAKVAAYKEALRTNVNTQPPPNAGGWSTAALEALMLTNDAAEAVAAEADDFITVTLGQSYPVEFNL